MIPFILLAASGACAVLGSKATATAVNNFNKAKEKVQRAKKKYEKVRRLLEKDVSKLNEELNRLSEVYERSLKLLEAVKIIFEEYGRKIKLSKKEMWKFRTVKYSVNKLSEDIDLASKILEGGVKSAVGALIVGGETYLSAIALGTAIGTASTGTAISSLSGAAYTNALLAWFGGGAVAAGGGGMALGTMVLGGIVAGPAVAVAGFTLASKSEEALTEATKFELRVKKVIKEMEVKRKKAKYIARKAYERRKVLKTMNAKLEETLNRVTKNPENKEDFLILVTLAESVRNIISTPLVNKGGKGR